MNLLAIVFLLGLAVIVSGFPGPLGHGQSIIRNEFGGNGFDGSRNFGNLDFGHMGRQMDSPNNGGNYVFDRSVANSNGFGASGRNSAYMNDGFGPSGNDQVGRISGDIVRNFDRSVGNSNGLGASGQNSAYTYDGSGPSGNVQVGRISGDIVRNFDGSVGNSNGLGASGQNSAYMYDGSEPSNNIQAGRISGDMFRNFGRDGIELGGYLAFE